MKKEEIYNTFSQWKLVIKFACIEDYLCNKNSIKELTFYQHLSNE